MIEMNRDNIRIDPVLEVDTDWNPPCISAYIEIWFDVDKKFGTHTYDGDDAWINLYATAMKVGMNCVASMETPRFRLLRNASLKRTPGADRYSLKEH